MEVTEKAICTASRQYQNEALKKLDDEGLCPEDYKNNYQKIIGKSCICTGLGASVLLKNNLDTKLEGDGVSICPVPNLAYFSEKMSLKDFTNHIYGRANMISRTDRPNMFIKELNLYLEYYNNKMLETKNSMTPKQIKYLNDFGNNLSDGIQYYEELLTSLKHAFKETKAKILNDLKDSKTSLQVIYKDIENLTVAMS